MIYPNSSEHSQKKRRDLEFLKEQIRRKSSLAYDVSEALAFLAELAGTDEEDRQISLSPEAISGMGVMLHMLAEKALEVATCEIYPYDLDDLVKGERG